MSKKKEFIAVTIFETYAREVYVRAEDSDAAIDCVSELYDNGHVSVAIDADTNTNYFVEYELYETSKPELVIDRAFLAEAIKEITLNQYDSQLPPEWTVADADIDLVVENTPFFCKNEFERFISQCVRIDTKTHRLITNGFICFDGDAYFAKECDALEYLKANNYEIKKDDESGVDDNFYYTEWL